MTEIVRNFDNDNDTLNDYMIRHTCRCVIIRNSLSIITNNILEYNEVNIMIIDFV